MITDVSIYIKTCKCKNQYNEGNKIKKKVENKGKTIENGRENIYRIEQKIENKRRKI